MKILSSTEINNHPQLTESLLMTRQLSQGMGGYMCHEFVHILYILKEIMGKECKNYLEIGTHNGGSLLTVMQSHYPTTFYALDYWPRPSDMKHTKNNITKHNKHAHPFHLIRGSSLDPIIVEKVKDQCPVVDMLFIDGGHEYHTVINDFESYSSLVCSKGIIVFDDYLMFERPSPVKFTPVEKKRKGQVRQAVDYLAEKYKNDYNIIGVIPNKAQARSKGLWEYNIDYIMQKK